MTDLIVPALRIVAALFLVALNGLFVAAEFAFVRIRATQIDRLVREGKSTAGLVQTARRKLDAYLAVCQLGITISSLGLGALGEPVVAALIEPLLVPLGVPEGLMHTIAFVIAFGIISFFHVVFGELAPKTVAIQSPEGTSLFVAPFMLLFYYLLLPLTTLFNGTANAITGALGVPPASESDETHSEEEIRTLIAQSTQHGVLEDDEEAMISGVFSLEDTTAREIMVPRPDVVALSAEVTLDGLVMAASTGHYTRYPVHESGTPDRVIGAVHVKDVLRAVGSRGDTEAGITARDLVREVLVVPENRPLDGILEDFQKQELQMAIVIDEWGSFEGLITIEDIIEELVGEIRDEFDEEEGPAIRERPDGSWLVDGLLAADELKERLGLGELPREEEADYQTVGGMVMDALGRVPEEGDRFGWEGYSFEVLDMDGRRVDKVLASPARETDAPEASS